MTTAIEKLARVLFEAHISRTGWAELTPAQQRPWLGRAGKAAAVGWGCTAPTRVAAVGVLNAFWLGSVVFTYDWLVWQALSSNGGVTLWTHTADGQETTLDSVALITRNAGQELTVVFDPSSDGGGLI